MEKISMESSDSQYVEVSSRVASLSDFLRNERNSEAYKRRIQEGLIAHIRVAIHGSILRKIVDLMTLTLDEPAAIDTFIAENRAILFQLALASIALKMPTITITLRDAITTGIKGKTTDEIRAYFEIAETRNVVLSEEDEEGFELVASVVDRERTQKLPQIADRDSLVTACHFCKQEFSMTLRKHHCRKCFRVFCNNCANELVDMPDTERTRAEDLIGTSALTKVRNFIWVLTLKRNPLTAARLCSVCVFEQNQDVRVTGTTDVFRLCGLELPELMALRGVCLSWTWAAEMCVNDITLLLDTLPTHVFSLEECELLWANRAHFVGHNRWLVQLLRSVDWTDKSRADAVGALLEDGTRHCDCRLLRCAKCQPTLTFADAYELLVARPPVAAPKVRAALVRVLRTAEMDDLYSFLPGLVRALADEPAPRASALFSFLMETASSDCEFGVQLYWALYVASLDKKNSVLFSVLRDLLLATLASSAGMGRVDELLSGMELVAILREHTSKPTLQEVIDELGPALARAGVLSATQSVRLPVSPLFEAVGLSAEGIRRLPSSVAPILLPFVGTKHAPALSPANGYSVATSGVGASRAADALADSGAAATASSTVSSSSSQPLPFSAAAAAASPTAAGPATTAAHAGQPKTATGGQAKRTASLSTSPAARGPVSSVRANQLKVAFKKEDMRKDWIVQGLLSYMHRCLARDKIEVPVLTYRVLPTSDVDGLVEWVPDSMTLTEIETSYHKNIQNYLVNNNDNVQVSHVRRTFMKSLAASMIMTFLLLVGDRHKENMMIHHSGTFFHIDYGYVLGEDPKPMLRLNLALKSEMIDALGGEGNPLYLEFRQFTTTIYNSLRKHASTIISMMMLLLHSLPEIKSGCDVKLLEQELITRFAVGRSDQEAEEMLRLYMDGDLEAVIRGPLHDRMHEIPRNVQHVATKVGEQVRLLADAAVGLVGFAAEAASRHLPSFLPGLYGAAGAVPDHPWLQGEAEDSDHEDPLASMTECLVQSDAPSPSATSRPDTPDTPDAPAPAMALPMREPVVASGVVARGAASEKEKNAVTSAQALASPPSPALNPATSSLPTSSLTPAPAPAPSPAPAPQLACFPPSFPEPAPLLASGGAPRSLPRSSPPRELLSGPATHAPPLVSSSPPAALPPRAAHAPQRALGSSPRADAVLGTPFASPARQAVPFPPPTTAAFPSAASPPKNAPLPHAPSMLSSSPRSALPPAQPTGLGSSGSGMAQMPPRYVPSYINSISHPLQAPPPAPPSAHLVSLSPPPPLLPGPSSTVRPALMDFNLFDMPPRAPAAPSSTTHAPLLPRADPPAPSSSSGTSSFFSSSRAPTMKQTPAPAARPASSHVRGPQRWRVESGSPELSDDNFEDTQDSL
eukprot:m.120826 g.120826  ORF g.120826 m.120826 type:complete len:1378 (+) comp14562_c2_seq1:302-4435(+)